MAQVGRSTRILALCLLPVSGLASSVVLTGCRVAEKDNRRWEQTELGPDKLVAVLVHDKYEWPLRIDAAASLIRMKRRAVVAAGFSGAAAPPMTGMPEAADGCFQIALRINQEIGGDDHRLAFTDPIQYLNTLITAGTELDVARFETAFPGLHQNDLTRAAIDDR